MLNLEQIEVVMPGGGSGGITITDALLDDIPNITAITNGTDEGGHTFRIRSLLKIGPVGDPTQQMAVRVRSNGDIRKLFTYRFPENGNRAANEFLAAAVKVAGGSLSGGIKLLEESFKAHYVGRVIPVSDQYTHLRTFLSDGRILENESDLDEFMKTSDNHLAESVKFHEALEPNPEAIEALERAHTIIIPPGSRLGSIHAILEVPGISEAMARSTANLICFTNAVDVTGWKASKSLRYIAERAGRKIDLAIIDTPNYPIPDTYLKINHYPVIPDVDACYEFAAALAAKPITRIYELDGYPTIRHDGKASAEIVKQFLLNQAELVA